MFRKQLILGICASTVTVFAAQAMALPIPNSAQSIITDQAMNNVHGVVQSNLAAGSSNLQANVANIIMSPNGQGANGVTSPVQQVNGSTQGGYSQQQALIQGNSLQGANGLISINQAAGNGNAEANQSTIVLGAAQPVSNQLLSQSVSSVPSDAKNSTKGESSQVAVAATAFRNAGGIAQVNQTSGSGNSSANSFTLGVAPGVLQ